MSDDSDSDDDDIENNSKNVQPPGQGDVGQFTSPAFNDEEVGR